MSRQIQRRQNTESPLALPPSVSLRSELRHFMGSFDRPTVVFWSTQLACWLLVVVVAMIWGLGG